MKTIHKYSWAILLSSFMAFQVTSCKDRKQSSDVLGNGVGDGNGGDAVVCEQMTPEMLGNRAMLRDLYEAVSIHKLKLDLGGKDLTVRQKVELLISRIENFDKDRFKRFSDYKDKMFSGDNINQNEVELDYNLAIPELTDEGSSLKLPDPKEAGKCAIKNVAFQPPVIDDDNSGIFQGNKAYSIKAEYYTDMFDADNRAGLIFHEIVYRDLVAQLNDETLYKEFVPYHSTSMFIRKYVGLIASDRMKDMSFVQYRDILRSSVHFPLTISVGGFVIPGLSKDGLAAIDQIGHHLPSQRVKTAENGDLYVGPDSLVYFYASQMPRRLESGKHSETDLSSETIGYGPDGYQVAILTLTPKCHLTGSHFYTFEWFENGYLSMIEASLIGNSIYCGNTSDTSKREFVTRLGTCGPKAWQRAGSRDELRPIIRFHENGSIKSGCAEAGYEQSPLEYRLGSGDSISLANQSFVEFNEDGAVMEATLAKATLLKSADGTSRDYPAGTALRFDGNGLVSKILD